MDLADAGRRWLYRGGRVHQLARLLNRAQAQLAARGIGPGRVAALDVVGRRTGRMISFPVVVADFQGERYLVSMLGDNTNWVRNVRAADGQAVLRHRRREVVRLDEVEPGERAPILRRYLECAPGARSHIAVDRRAPLEQFERIAVRYPVFRITVPQATDRTGAPLGNRQLMTTAARRRGGTGRSRAVCPIDLAIGIRRPPEAVYALLADIQNAEPIPRGAVVRMIKDPAGPATIGTQWHEHVRLAPGCWLHIESVVTEADEPRRLGMDFHSLWFTGHLTYEIDGTKDGSVLHHGETLRPRLLLRPFAPLIEQRLRPQLERRLKDIKQLLEQ